MKKRILCILMVLTMAVLAGCSGDSKSALECKFSVPGSSTTLTPLDKFDVSSIESATTGYLEASSCYYDGMDKTYYYDGYEVVTFPKADGDYVQDIYVTGSSIKLPSGVGVGSSLDDVINAYGKDYTVEGKNYKYSVGSDSSKYVYFYVLNNVVKGYGFSAKVN